jgi:DNA polymerase-1
MKSDHVIVSADFNQQELRILAAESGDPTMVGAYTGEKTKDLHTITACSIAPVEIKLSRRFRLTDFQLDDQGRIDYGFYEDVRSEEDELGKFLDRVRGKGAKPTNFLIVFGGGAGTLSTNLRIPKDTAKGYIDAWLSTYPGVPDWWEEVIKFARRNGYVQTVYGTRRHCWPNIISQDGRVRSGMERQVINYRIQGMAAEILKIVLRKTVETRLFEETGARLIAPIYDEITSSVPKATTIEYIRRLSELMAITPPGHCVPQVPEIAIGRECWGYRKELKANPSDEAILAAIEGPAPERAPEAEGVELDMEITDAPWELGEAA